MSMLQSVQRILHLMHSILRRLDLNLLIVFDALHRRRSVVAAAEELSITASAFSHALTRLRSALNDELFIRAGGVMQPTPRANELAGGIATALQLLTRQIGDDTSFDPSASDQTFIFAATDFTTFALMPALITRMESTAPRLRIQVVPSQSRDALSDLTSGAHFVLGFSDEFAATAPDVERLEAKPEDYVVVSRKGHPRISKTLSLKRYLAERHVLVRPWQKGIGVIDAALNKEGLERDVAVEIPSVMVAPFIIARSDLLITLPRRVAQALAECAQVVLHAPPFPTPAFRPTVYFQRQHTHLAWHRWMRDQIVATLPRLAA